jgi:hypothetical protein
MCVAPQIVFKKPIVARSIEIFWQLDVSAEQGSDNHLCSAVGWNLLEFCCQFRSSNSKFWLVVFDEPYAGGVAPQTPIGGRYAALQTSHVGVNFAELPRCLNRCC